jgi:sortase B
MGMITNEIHRKSIRWIHWIIDFAILLLILLMMAFAGYSMWDSEQVHTAADSSQYEMYRPSVENEGKSFKELQEINPEVIAWLTVYGTNIDYPVTQGPDNMKYVNTSAEGLHSLSGAIFLDTYNSKDFKDFNNILYGHHMERRMMFGEIETFVNKDVFDSRLFGNLFFDNKDHGIEFFAFAHTDAYNREVFTAGVREDDKERYLDNLLTMAIHKRDINVSITDNIILLSTCSSTSTNGRDILIGRIVDEVFENPFPEIENSWTREVVNVDGQGISQGKMYVLILGAALLAFGIILTVYYVGENIRKGRADE